MLNTVIELRAIEQAAAAAQPLLPVGTATSISLIDWSAAHMGNRAMCAAMDAWLAEAPMSWLTTADWL